MDLSIKGVPEDQVMRLCLRAKANHRTHRLSIDEISERVDKLG